MYPFSSQSAGYTMEINGLLYLRSGAGLMLGIMISIELVLFSLPIRPTFGSVRYMQVGKRGEKPAKKKFEMLWFRCDLEGPLPKVSCEMRPSPVFLALMPLDFITRPMVRSAHLALSHIRFTAQFDFAV